MSSYVFGIAAAALQVAGYIFYMKYILKSSIRPNAISFLMFAYGTAFLTYLEWDNQATPAMLALPLACTVMGVIIAFLCIQRSKNNPIGNFEAFAFGTDLWMTALFGGLSLATIHNPMVSFYFLLACNATVIISFFPIIKSTYQHPEHELPLPWFIWTSAYGCLVWATILDGGENRPILLLYPLVNFILHALIAGLSMRKTGAGVAFIDGDMTVHHRPSGIHGTGMFAGRSYGAGQTIWKLSGRPVVGSHTDEDANCVGFGPDLWIDPDPPFDCVNHSCNPNAAFGRKGEFYAIHPIANGDEITMDYSTTEADPEWQMECTCGASNCRKRLYAIHISFASDTFPPLASPGMQEVWREMRRPYLTRSAFPQLKSKHKRELFNIQSDSDQTQLINT